MSEAWDDVDAQDPETVRQAREVEMKWYKKLKVDGNRPMAECFTRAGKPPINVKLTDHIKRYRRHMNVKSTKQCRQGGRAVRGNTAAGGACFDSRRVKTQGADDL